MGTVMALAVKPQAGASMREVTSVNADAVHGLSGNEGNTGSGQVTVLAWESWLDTLEALGHRLPWTTRRANLLVEGIDLKERTGQLLRVGTCLLKVLEETKPCSQMQRAFPGLLRALAPDWRGGLRCRIVVPGSLTKGDVAFFEES